MSNEEIVDAIRDHPRGCGEHPMARLIRPLGRGSSPRMRGAPKGLIQENMIIRIIPADAGSTRCRGRRETTRWDHPRGCGEHDCTPLKVCTLDGSSPRMRGAPCAGDGHQYGLGIIPADAGSTDYKRLEGVLYEDHPRGCGEHLVSSPDVSMWTGSSPRMRGAHSGVSHLVMLYRIIPADAGSTADEHVIALVGWDHPRGCGEHGHGLKDYAVRPGSSPRMRGARSRYRSPIW